MLSLDNSFDRPTLTLRIHAGLNAQTILAGLLALTASPLLSAQELLSLRFPNLDAQLKLTARSVHSISGVTVELTTPAEHTHRHVSDIMAIYDQNNLSAAALEKVQSIWMTLARAESLVHNESVANVHFHEVGRMANIISIGLIAELITTLNPRSIVVSPIPLGDGAVCCAHGLVPNPAPSLFAMLEGVPVCPVQTQAETVTPTGLAVLLGLQCEFGGWPSMCISKCATAFHPKAVFENIPNGVLFALGR